MENPFIVNPNFTINVINLKYTETKNNKRGTTTTISLYPVEKQKGTTLYDTPYDRQFLFSLKPKTRDILLYIMVTLEPYSVEVDLHYKKVSKHTNMSNKSFYLGVEELVNASIICNKKKSVFWINPIYLFKGDRLKYFTANYPDKINVEYEKDMSYNQNKKD